MVWFYELHYRETKFPAICRAVYKNKLYTGLLYSGYLLSGRGVTRGTKGVQFTGRRMTAGDAAKSQQYHKYFIQDSASASERPPVQTWGRQACFLPRAPPNLVTPLLCGTCCQKLIAEWHWLKFLKSQIFLHFGQFNFCSSQVCDKRLVNWTAIIDYINTEWIYKERKAWFNSWKCPNLAWNSSSSLKIYFSVLPLCGLQSPLRDKHSFSLWHWKNDRMLFTIRVWKIVIFLWELK